MGIIASTYAIRISNIVKPTLEDPNGRRVIFAFGGGFKVPKGYEYVEISFNMGRLVFRFLKERYSVARTSVMKRVCKLTKASSNTWITSCTLKGFIELMEGWEGEYDELPVFPHSKPEDYKFYLKRDMRHLYSIMPNGSTAVINHVEEKPDILEEDAKQASIPNDMTAEEVKKEISKTTLKEALTNYVEGVQDTVSKIFGGPSEPDICGKRKEMNPVDDYAGEAIHDEFDKAREECEMLKKLRQNEYDLCQDIISRAEECTKIMANGVITLLEFRLLRRPLSIGEAEANVEFHKIYLKYLRLENAIKDLMTNVRHTWEDGNKLYDAYKNVKKDYPDMDENDIANYLHVGPEELHETIEAMKHLEEEHKDEKAKIGFQVED